MNYQKTQIYLEPEVHAKLVREAEDKGISLAELIRRLTVKHVGETATPYGDKSFEAIFDLGDAGEPSDISRDFDQLMGTALDDLYEKKMGRSPRNSPEKPVSRKRKRR